MGFRLAAGLGNTLGIDSCYLIVCQGAPRANDRTAFRACFDMLIEIIND